MPNNCISIPPKLRINVSKDIVTIINTFTMKYKSKDKIYEGGAIIFHKCKIKSELKKYTKDATVMIVAQRIGTILNADKIVVLDNGKCVGVGTHKELMKKCKVYKEIALSQVSKEELENV